MEPSAALWNTQNVLPGNTVGSLSPIQHAVLVGSLLGDGTLRCQGTRTNALLEVNHAFACKQYVDWKYAIFQEYVRTPPKRRYGNGTRVAYRFTTRSLPVFTKYYAWFYINGKKRVPRDLQLDAPSLAVWFMDDGSRSRNSSYLNTQQFSVEEQQFLAGLLQESFGIGSHRNRDKGYWRLRLTVEGTKILHTLIEPYIHECFRYKLGHDPVTTEPKGEALQYAGQYADPCLPSQTMAVANGLRR